MQVLRIVVASPGDVQTERNTLERVTEELNQGIAADRDLHLEVYRWETRAFPGLHQAGPQGQIDSALRIEDCDLLIGIFWKRFGTPVIGAQSGTEHEFQIAYDAWKQKGRPQVWVYFNQKQYVPASKEETDQLEQVQEFKRNFPKEGLWWSYTGRLQFERLVRLHLTQFILQRRSASETPVIRTESSKPVDTQKMVPDTPTTPVQTQPQQSTTQVQQAPARLPRMSRRSAIELGIVTVGVLLGGTVLLQRLRPPINTSVTTSPPPAVGTTLLKYQNHTGQVHCSVWSPDGRRIASASSDKTVRVWDALTGSHPFIYSRHTDVVYSAAWSPDGKYLASGGLDKTVQVWNASTGNTLFTYRGHHGTVNRVAWSPDGTRIASTSDDTTVQVWDAFTGSHRLTYRGHKGITHGVAWSNDGKRIASSSADKTVQIWDASSGTKIFTYQHHNEIVYTVAWSPDNTRLASSGDDDTAQVWEPSLNTAPLIYKRHTDAVHTVAWSHNGKLIATASDDSTAHVWNPFTGDTILVYRKHSDQVNWVAWSPHNMYIASASHDTTVQVWQAPSS